MKYIRPSHVGLALLAGTLTPGPVNANDMGMPSVPHVHIEPVRPSVPSFRPPDISGPVHSAVESAVDSVRRRPPPAQGAAAANLNEFNEIKAKARAKYPNATVAQINAAATKHWNKLNKQRVDAANLEERLNNGRAYRRADRAEREREKAAEAAKAPAAAKKSERNSVNWGSHPSIEKDPVVGN